MTLLHIRRWWALAALPLIAAIGFLASDPSSAATKKKASAPQISSFEMEPPDRLAAGGELFFRLQGTAGGKATVRVTGVSRTIVLDEVDDGTYEGAYRLRRADKPTPRSAVTGLLRKNGLSTTSRIQFAMPAAAQAPAAAPQAQAPAQPLAIQRFSAEQVDRLEPGTELKFALDATPGQRASFAIEGIGTTPMREVRPGRYEGSYTVKRLDRIGGVPIVAMLEGANGAWVKSELRSRQLLVDTRPPVVRNQQPKDGDVVPEAGPVTVSGTFDDHGGLGVDPQSVKVVVGGRDVTAQTTVTRDFFTYRGELPQGSYAADVSAKDLAGNAVRSAWSFRVAPGALAGAGTGSVTPVAAGPLPLEFTSHQPNAAVPSGRVQVRGRTAPNATVDVEVVGLAAVVGMIGVSNKVYADRIQADAQGNFQFEFTPQAFIAGTRYEIDAKASAGGQTRESKLVLFAQR
jgi:hypothetical protein